MTAATAVREGPILMSGPMVRATLDGSKTQTRRVVKLPPFVSAEGALARSYDDRLASLRASSPNGPESAYPLILGHRYEGQRLVLNRADDVGVHSIACPYGQPGDRLWVRETWTADFEWPMGPGQPRIHRWDKTPECARTPANAQFAYFAADRTAYAVEPDGLFECSPSDDYPWDGVRWRPSIHMPRWVSRLLLEVTGVRVERVQEISEADAVAEGVAAYAEAYMATGNPLELTPVEQYEYLWNALNEPRGYGWDVNPWVWVLEFRRVTP